MKWETEQKIHTILQMAIVLVAGITIGWYARAILREPPVNVPQSNPQGRILDRSILIGGNSLKALRFNFIYGETLGALVTAYNPVPEQTDSTPDIMASGNKVYEGAIACPSRIPLGSIAEIDGESYVCEDRMHPRNDGMFDIMMFSYEEAVEFGTQHKIVKIYY